MPSNAFKIRTADQQARLARNFPVKCLFQQQQSSPFSPVVDKPVSTPPAPVMSPVKKIINSFLRPSGLITTTTATEVIVPAPRVLQEFNSHDNVIIGKSPKFSMFVGHGQLQQPENLKPPVNGSTTQTAAVEQDELMSKKHDADGPLIMTAEPEINGMNDGRT